MQGVSSSSKLIRRTLEVRFSAGSLLNHGRSSIQEAPPGTKKYNTESITDARARPSVKKAWNLIPHHPKKEPTERAARATTQLTGQRHMYTSVPPTVPEEHMATGMIPAKVPLPLRPNIGRRAGLEASTLMPLKSGKPIKPLLHAKPFPLSKRR
jgi:hypothetical protein